MGSKAPPTRFLGVAEDELTQPETVSPASSEASLARSAQLLRVIADTLGMPTTDFYLRKTTDAKPVAGSEATNECSDLLRAFLRIRDPEKRRQLLELVRSAGDEE
ncbi:hypothetical protein [Methylobacterium soli]|uniref:Uncharacterized protein n=1 Tax=Methylobacterium soli TaxID=553447 RepID=A0A6L3SQL7_9HYPH|nr:hypothetical protein [Methylobacterium soli]KAB1073540.1 hypothetical protein F6X53_26930 [Methylobacterium soli]GJE44081.1 hypothetical protein AEGHOMDF_3267 [Methylobacterium soli]